MTSTASRPERISSRVRTAHTAEASPQPGLHELRGSDAEGRPWVVLEVHSQALAARPATVSRATKPAPSVDPEPGRLAAGRPVIGPSPAGSGTARTFLAAG